MIKQVAFQEICPISLKTSSSNESSSLINVLNIKDFISLSDCVSYKIFDKSEWEAASFQSSDCVYIIDEGILKRVTSYNDNYNDYYKINSLNSSTGVLIQGTDIEYSSINFYLVNVKNEGGTIVEVISNKESSDDSDNEFDLSNCISVITFPDGDGDGDSTNITSLIMNEISETNSSNSDDDFDTTEQDDNILKNNPNATSIEIDEEDLESAIQALPPNNPYIVDLLTDNFEELVKSIEIFMPDTLADYQTENWLDEDIETEAITEPPQSKATSPTYSLYGIKMVGYFTYHEGEEEEVVYEDDEVIETDEEPV